MPQPRPLSHPRGRSRRTTLVAVALATALAAGGAALGTASSASAAATAPGSPASAGAAPVDLGPNVIVFDPSMSVSEIQAEADAVSAQQVGNQFGDQRYALLFKPGTYGSASEPLKIQVGYYTEVAGLGLDPGDVTINGSVDVFNQCDADGCLALNNFWRSLSNLTINPLGGEGCRTNTEFWAVSQAAPMRRVHVTGATTFMDYCTAGPQYASGGFAADSEIDATAVSGSQQQFYTRNSQIGGWSNGVWNQVFSGVQGAPAQSFGQAGANPYTTLATTPVSREKPYLYVTDGGDWNVFVPSAESHSSGTSWSGGHTAGRSVPLSDFAVVTSDDSATTINAALAEGRDLLLTPGVYDLDRTLSVTHADTVVLGLGLPSLTPTTGKSAMDVADVAGVDVAGVTFDAGAKKSRTLLEVGRRHQQDAPHQSSGSDPIALQDVFFRIGGPHVGRAKTSLEVNADHVVLDDIWAWRADHGTGVGWTTNTAAHGVVVNGDDVTATGLFVEHYQKENVIWNGERGRTVFFQNELPYDAPNQAAWTSAYGDGYPAYVVGKNVEHHHAWGLGSYIFTNVDPTLHATNAFVVPDAPGVVMRDLVTISLNKAGTIDHVINGVGDAVTPDRAGPENVISYRNGKARLGE